MVTGCGKQTGIGRAIAERLSDEFAVVVTDVEPKGVPNLHDQVTSAEQAWQGLPSVVEEIRLRGGEAAFVVGDVSRGDDAARMIAEVLESFGRVDVLVNNASAPQGRDFGEIDEIPVEAWNSMIEVNVHGVFLMIRSAVPSMRAQQWGRIINIASIAGLVGRPRSAAYSASKAAVIGLTKSLALDLAGHGVTVNAVCPGSVLTSRAYSAARRQGECDVESALSERAAQIPVGRYGRSDDIASAVAYLASESASYVTGHALTVDGGGVRV